VNHNPLEHDPEREARIRARAYRLWEEDGRPHGRDVEFWERARVLVGMEESASSGRLPNPLSPDPGSPHPQSPDAQSPDAQAPDPQPPKPAAPTRTRPAKRAAKVEEAPPKAKPGKPPGPLKEQGDRPSTPKAKRTRKT
jgi:hypothetical protein